jgi:hypothetical protein
MQATAEIRGSTFFFDGDDDLAFFGELDGISEQVDENLCPSPARCQSFAIPRLLAHSRK